MERTQCPWRSHDRLRQAEIPASDRRAIYGGGSGHTLAFWWGETCPHPVLSSKTRREMQESRNTDSCSPLSEIKCKQWSICVFQSLISFKCTAYVLTGVPFGAERTLSTVGCTELTRVCHFECWTTGDSERVVGCHTLSTESASSGAPLPTSTIIYPLKGIRRCPPNMPLWQKTVLSWRQLRSSRHRKSSLASSICLKAGHKFPFVKESPSPPSLIRRRRHLLSLETARTEIAIKKPHWNSPRPPSVCPPYLPSHSSLSLDARNPFPWSCRFSKN